MFHELTENSIDYLLPLSRRSTLFLLTILYRVDDSDRQLVRYPVGLFSGVFLLEKIVPLFD